MDKRRICEDCPVQVCDVSDRQLMATYAAMVMMPERRLSTIDDAHRHEAICTPDTHPTESAIAICLARHLDGICQYAAGPDTIGA